MLPLGGFKAHGGYGKMWDRGQLNVEKAGLAGGRCHVALSVNGEAAERRVPRVEGPVLGQERV